MKRLVLILMLFSANAFASHLNCTLGDMILTLSVDEQDHVLSAQWMNSDWGLYDAHSLLPSQVTYQKNVATVEHDPIGDANGTYNCQ